MNASMPFDPLDAYESLQSLLPPFSLELSKSDLRGFIVDGFVTRRFVLRGRFHEFGHTRAMRSPDEMTVGSFLTDKIPKSSVDPVYCGDAVGFLIEGKNRIYTRDDHLWLTDLPDDETLVFVYQRPSIWQPTMVARDLVFHVQYAHEFEIPQSETPRVKSGAKMGVIEFLNHDDGAASFLIEAFRLSVERNSRFGYSAAALRAMKGLALIYRICKRYEEAKEILGKVLGLSYSTLSAEDEMKYELHYDFGALYLDQADIGNAENQFFLVERKFRQSDKLSCRFLYAKAVESLAAAAFHRGHSQQAESLLLSILNQQTDTDEQLELEHLAVNNKLGLVYWSQGLLDRARTVCVDTLERQERHLGPTHYHSLRTMHNLAGILSEKGLMSESQMVYVRELRGLALLLKPGHPDALRTRGLLAHQYYEKLQFDEALKIWKELLDGHKSALGLKHPSSMEAQYQVAQILGILGSLEESVEHLEILCRNAEEFYGRSHPVSRRAKILLSNVLFRHDNLYSDLTPHEHQSTAAPRINKSRPTDVSFDAIDIEERLNVNVHKIVEGTCNWILEDPSYKAWINSRSPSLLWIRGSPGCGKTVLTSAIINRLRKKQYPVAFFFFEARKSATSDPVLFLESFKAQLQRYNATLEGDSTFLPKKIVSPISRLFAEFSEMTLRFDELYCCIDAIDECNESRDLLLRLISQLVLSKSFPVKFLLSSRPTPDIIRSIGDVGRIIEIPNKNTREDIRKFTASLIPKLGEVDWSGNIDRLVDEADGIFLWVEMVIKTAQMTGKLLDTSIGPLEDIYRDSLASLITNLSTSDTEILCLLFYWLTTACRALKVKELHTALAVEPSDTKLEDLKLLSSPYESITRLGGPLLRILPDDSVILIHQSLVSFLRKEPTLEVSPRIALPIKPEKANAYIGEICISYLSFDYPYDPNSRQIHVFLDYAATYWYVHALRAGMDGSVLHSVLSFLRSSQCFNWLDALVTFFGKNVEDLLHIQSQISHWMCQFEEVDMAQYTAFVLNLYRQKVMPFGTRFPVTHENIVTLQRLADICQASGYLDEAERFYQRALRLQVEVDSDFQYPKIQSGSADIAGKEADLEASELSAKLKTAVPSMVTRTDLISRRNLASTYRKQGHWKEAEKIQLEVVKLAQEKLGPEDIDTITTLSDLASTYESQGRWKEAEEMEVQVTETLKKVLGQEHPSTLNSIDNLASTYSKQGRWKEAEELQVQVMENKIRIIARDHPSTLASMANLALIFWNQGRLSEAEELQIEVTNARKKVLGEAHPDTLASISNLARILRNQGRLKEAELLELEVVRIRRREMGEEHPDTLVSMTNLATVYANQGRWKEAVELQLHVVEATRRALGEDHPDTLTNMSKLTTLFWNLGRLKEAEELELQVLLIRKRTMAEEHPDTLTSMSNLASIYRTQGRWKEAEQLELRVLETSEKVLGAAHPKTLSAVINLASTLRNLGRLEKAEAMYLQALAGYEKVLGSDHPSTLHTVNDLGFLYMKLGRPAEAEDMYQRALQGYEEVLGSEHTSTLNTVDNLGTLYTDQGKLAKAEEMLQRALQGREKALGAEHISTLKTVNNLGILYKDQGKLSDAEKMLRRALQGCEKALGTEHSSTLKIVYNLGGLYKEQGKLAEAENMYQRALQGCENVLDAENLLTLEIVHSLGVLYMNQGKLAKAEEMLQRALQGCEKALGTEHTSTLNTIYDLGVLYQDQGKPAKAEEMFQRSLHGRKKTLSADHGAYQRLHYL